MRKLTNLFWALLAGLSLNLVSCDNADDILDLGPTTDQEDTNSSKNDGSEEKPYTAADIITKNPSSTETAVESGIWVKGYIVGYRDADYADHIGAQDAYTSNYNIYVADSATETDDSKCINVQLTTNFREILGLSAKPENFGKEVMIKGDIMKYNGHAGIKNMTSYKLDGEGPGEAETGDVTVSGDASTAAALISVDFQDAVNNQAITVANWQNVIVQGDRSWTGKIFEENGYAQATAHNAADGTYETWLISQGLDLSKAASKSFTFKSAQAYWKESTSFEVYVLQNVDGATVRTKVDVTNLPTSATTNYEFVQAENIDLSAYSGIVYVGFRYVALGGSSNSTTWCVDDVVLGGEGEVNVETTVSLRYDNYTATVGEELNCSLVATVTNGEGSTTFTAEGLPSWATLEVTAENEAVIKGTAPAEAGTYEVTVTAANNGIESTKTFTIIVKAEAVAGTELVINGSFEDWTEDLPTAWDNATYNNQVKETTIAHSGSNSAKIVSTSSTQKIQQEIEIEAGKTYKISYWYLDNVTNGRTRPWIFWLKGTAIMTENADVLRPSDYSTDSPEWVQKEFILTAPEGATKLRFEARVNQENNTNGGAIYFDDFSVIQID